MRESDQHSDERTKIELFEYKSLQTRVLRDSKASYTLMAALVALSEAVLAATLTNLDELNFVATFGAALASLSAMWFWYPFDRRFVWAEKKRLERMRQIEKALDFYNERLFMNPPDVDEDLLEELERIDDECGIYSRISIHRLYLVLGILTIIAWAFILVSRIMPQ